MQPMPFMWDGEAFHPANRHWARKCDERFVVGQSYTLDELHARSSATHAHYFATLHDIWQSLPEHLAGQYPTEEHMRKYALIKKGFHTMQQHVCKSEAEARRLAAVIKPYDSYQIVIVNGSVVTVYHAISQDYRSMDRATFAESKEKVLDWCAGLIGVPAFSSGASNNPGHGGSTLPAAKLSAGQSSPADIERV